MGIFQNTETIEEDGILYEKVKSLDGIKKGPPVTGTVWENYDTNDSTSRRKSLSFYKNGVREATSKEFHKNGKLKIECSYTNGELDGLFREWDEDGELVKEKYYGGEPDDIKESKIKKSKERSKYWEEKEIKEVNRFKNAIINLIDGKKSKESFEYVSLQQSLERKFYWLKIMKENKRYLTHEVYTNNKGEYCDGKIGDEKPISGIIYEVYENDALKTVLTSKNGIGTGEATGWYENGQLLEEGNLKESKRDGLWKMWYGNGQLKSKGNYKDGKEDGLFEMWYETGKILKECHFKDGKAIGLLKSYYENEQLYIEKEFSDGKVVSSKCWDEDGNEIECE